MQFLTEFLPLLLFLGAVFYKDIFFAVAVLMIAMPVGLILKLVVTRKLDKIYFWSTVFLLILGGATLYYRDPAFIKLKPTAFYWVLSVVFIASQWVGEKTIAERMFGKVGQMERARWVALNRAWAVFFIFAGGLNLYVAYNYSLETWATVKTIGLMSLTFVFALVQAIWMMRVMKPADDSDDPVEKE